MLKKSLLILVMWLFFYFPYLLNFSRNRQNEPIDGIPPIKDDLNSTLIINTYGEKIGEWNNVVFGKYQINSLTDDPYTYDLFIELDYFPNKDNGSIHYEKKIFKSAPIHVDKKVKQSLIDINNSADKWHLELHLTYYFFTQWWLMTDGYYRI